MTAAPTPSYFESREAHKLFLPLPDEPNASVALENQIQLLTDVNKSAEGYQRIIKNLKELNEDDITAHQKWILQQKAQYFAVSLYHAKISMNKWTWDKCCDEGIQQLQHAGLTLANNAKTVARWYHQFRDNRSFKIATPKKNLSMNNKCTNGFRSLQPKRKS